MLPRNNFENLHSVMAIQCFLDNFTQILFKLFDPDSECFVKYDTLCSHVFDYACFRRKAYPYGRGSKLWKNCKLYVCTSKTFLKMASRKIHAPHPTP